MCVHEFEGKCKLKDKKINYNECVNCPLLIKDKGERFLEYFKKVVNEG